MGTSEERKDTLKSSELGSAMIGAATLKKKGFYVVKFKELLQHLRLSDRMQRETL
jgi:hypothetical protein